MNIFDSASARILKFAIGRPVYDNRRLGDMDEWIMDNIVPLFKWYHSEPEPGINWKKEAIYFCRSQYQLTVQDEYNKEIEKKINA